MLASFFAEELFVERRRFLTHAAAALPLAGALPASAAALGSSQTAELPNDAQAGRIDKPGAYELRIYRMHQGPQGGQLDQWLTQRAIPLHQKHGFAPMGFFHVSIGDFTPKLIQVIAYRSLAEREARWAALEADPDWTAIVNELAADLNQPAFDDLEVRFLKALPFSPAWEPTPADKKHKIYEIRTYQSPSQRQLGVLTHRFASGEVDVFHRSGFVPVLYSHEIAGPMMPNLTYLIPFDSIEARDEEWSKFGRDPQWKTLLAESNRLGGDVVKQITNYILSPTSYSALR